MTTTILKRQWITDASGQPVGVILPIEEYTLVEDVLEQRVQIDDDLIRQIELAAHDPLYLADLQETMDAFAHVDAEWQEIVS